MYEKITMKTSNKWLNRFAVFTMLCTFILIFIGGLVKSTESGLAVPDWPTTYGENMFTFPLSSMVGGILYEHSHRLAASFVGFCILIMAFWIGFSNQKKLLKILGWSTLGAVIIQGILGGITVLFFLPAWISVTHGTLAQITFCLTIALAVVTSNRWKTAEQITVTSSLKLWSLITMVFIWLQLVIGAIMRHTESGLAAMDFPTMNGKWLPSFSKTALEEINNSRLLMSFENILDLETITTGQLFIHFLHRSWGYVVFFLVGWFMFKILRDVSLPRFLKMSAMGLGVLLVTQIGLGVMTVLSHKTVFITTLHVTNGAAVLGTAFFLSLWMLRK